MAAGWDALRQKGLLYQKKMDEETTLSNLVHKQCLELIKIKEELKRNPDYFDFDAQCNLCWSEESITEFNRKEAEKKGEFYMRFRLEELQNSEENVYIDNGNFFVNLEHPAIAKRLQEYMEFHHLSAPLSAIQRMEFEHKCNIEFQRLRVSNEDFFKEQLQKRKTEIARD